MEEYHELLTSQRDLLTVRRHPLFNRGGKKLSSDHVKVCRDRLLLSSETDFRSFFEELINKEREAETLCASVRGQKYKQRNAMYALWTKRVMTSLAVATAMEEPILTQVLDAVGTTLHLLDFPVVSPDENGSPLRSTHTSHHRIVVTERAFLLANLVSLAHTAYSSCDSRWPLRLEDPWYLKGDQVERIPRSHTMPKIRDRLQAMFTELEATRQERMSALHAKPILWVTSASLTGVMLLSTTEPSEHTVDEGVKTEQQQVLPLIQVSDSEVLPYTPYQDWQSYGIGLRLAHLSASEVSPAPSVGSAGSEVSDADSVYWDNYFRSLREEDAEDDDSFLS